MIIDEAIPPAVGYFPGGLAKKPTAFFRMSRSSVTRFNSLRSAAISSACVSRDEASDPETYTALRR